MIGQIAFCAILLVGITLFALRIRTVRKNILIGRDIDRSDNSGERWRTMIRVALGQSKMVSRPIAGILHIFVYLGFIIINIEVLEIVIDGVFGTHRVFSGLGSLYNILIGSFEVLALLVLVSCLIFLVRRNIIRIKRFHLREMTAWPKSDANIILVVECLLMFAFLSMNYADLTLQTNGVQGYAHDTIAGSFPISQHLGVIYGSWGNEGLIGLERFTWWFHIVGILSFLVYVPYSKHLHIFLAFPNTYYSNLKPLGEFNNLEAVTNEVKLMMDPNADPFAAPPADAPPPERFGAKDVGDLSWKQLLDAYSCTECGRCSSECPANQTGKLLSPRKIMMDTRDRLEEFGKVKDKEAGDGKSLLGDYITEEELWACTSCNACTLACPVNIDPLSIIVDMRRYLIMEESKSPESITAMFNNVENNGAPWAFSAMDRDKWKEEMS